MNRRELLKALAAGGVMTAAGLWMPGQKVYTFGPRHYPKFYGPSIVKLLEKRGREFRAVGPLQRHRDDMIDSYVYTIQWSNGAASTIPLP